MPRFLEMARVRVLKAGPLKGKDYTKGQESEFPDYQAEGLRALGLVEILSEPAPKKEAK